MISKEIVKELLNEKAKKQAMLFVNTLLLNPLKVSIELQNVLRDFLEEERESLLEEME